MPNGYKLSVGGGAIVEKVKVSLAGQWPDYVFNEGHSLPQLDSLQKFVKVYRHLPGIPSALEISHDGQDLGLIQKKLLEKIEELTLYVIDLKKDKETLEKRLSNVEAQLEKH